MRIIARPILISFWTLYKDSELPLRSWFFQVKKAKWNNPNEVKIQYANASLVQDSRVVFNIAGNKYRLVVHINYKYKIVNIKWLGTHKDYDKIDVSKVKFKK